MEIKEWTYEEFPEFSDTPEGVGLILSDGNEMECHMSCDEVYAEIDGYTLHLQILRPYTRNEGEMLLPCIAFVQGSAWMEQDVYQQLPMMTQLARRGYVLACVQYRPSSVAQFPAQVKDARNAVRYLKKNAEKYGIDPEKMILAGDSSGGHTAVFGGIIKDDDSEDNLFPGISADVKGILALYASSSVMREDGNPTTLNHHMPDSPEGMVMGGINLLERPDLCRKLSAECNIFPDTELPPILLFHGTKDRTVSTVQSVTLYCKLKECGKDVSLYLVKGGDHGGAEYWTKDVLDIEEAFFGKCFA